MCNLMNKTNKQNRNRLLEGGTPKKPNFIYKRSCIYSDIAKLVTFKVLSI